MRCKTQLSLENSRESQARTIGAILATLLLATVATASSMAQVQEQARSAIERAIGSRGTYFADERVYKVILPREAATIVQDYQTLSPNLGLNSWVAFMPAIHHDALLTGQLILVEDEVDSVLKSALNVGLQVTGLADISTFDGPRVKALDVKGVGTYQDLAAAFRKTLDEIRLTRIDKGQHVARFALPELHLDSSIDAGPLDAILSMRGSVSQGVYRAAIGRHALLQGETVGREMGMSTWIAFAGSDDRALAQGEFATTSDELQNLLKALLSKGFKITSIRNHSAGEHPQFLFVRFWQQGRSAELARGLRYALDVQIGANATGSDAKHVE